MCKAMLYFMDTRPFRTLSIPTKQQEPLSLGIDTLRFLFYLHRMATMRDWFDCN